MGAFQAGKDVIHVIILGMYEELAPGMGFPSIKESLHDKSYESKATVLEHLKNGTVHMVTASKVVDIFTGEKTNIELVYMNDGQYSWSSKIPYYVEKYNLRLPEDFETYILK